MKTIEQKAKEAWENYEYRATPHLYNSVFEDGYVLGAKEALASQWRSAAEELPEYNKEVLIKHPRGLKVGRCTEEKEWFSEGFPVEGSVYWMPIPEPPITREEIEFNERCNAYRAMRAGAKDENGLKDRINAFRSGNVNW